MHRFTAPTRTTRTSTARLRAGLPLAAPFLLLLAPAAQAQLSHSITYGEQWSERHGHAIANVGDLDGDGRDNLVVGSPRWDIGITFSAGRIYVYPEVGNNGPLYTLDGTQTGAQFGHAICGVGDVDGDGAGDFVVGSPYWNTATLTDAGKLELFSGATGALLRTVSGGQPNAALGSLLEATDDLNGDGVLEWIAQAASPPRHELRDGATGGRYYVAFHPSADTYVAVRAARSPVSANGDSFGDLLLIDRFAQRGITEAWMVALDDLLLHFDPPTAYPGLPIELRLGGGPAGNRCGLLLVDINGLPIHQWVAIGMFDALREFTVTDLVPPGLSGLEYTLQGYAVGFNGRVIDTDPQLLQFE